MGQAPKILLGTSSWRGRKNNSSKQELSEKREGIKNTHGVAPATNQPSQFCTDV